MIAIHPPIQVKTVKATVVIVTNLLLDRYLDVSFNIDLMCLKVWIKQK